MARIKGVILPPNKRIEIGLTYIFGIGRSLSNKILKKTKINPDIRVKDITREQEKILGDMIEKEYSTEGDLRREITLNIKRLKDINCYRGQRHKFGLPARGQRTKTNSRTVRGNTRRTVATARRAAAEKT